MVQMIRSMLIVNDIGAWNNVHVFLVTPSKVSIFISFTIPEHGMAEMSKVPNVKNMFC